MINDKKNKEVNVFKYGDTNINKGPLKDVILKEGENNNYWYFVTKPEYKGMTLITMQWVDISLIKKKKGTNTGRNKSVKEQTKIKYSQYIEAGKYEPYKYEPPMVEYEEDGYYYLVTGITRTGAFKLTNEKKIWVAVVKFDTFENREIAKSLENKANNGKDFGQVTREEIDDTQNSVKIILTGPDYKGVEITEDLIYKTLDKLQIDNVKDRREAFKKAKETFNVISKVKDIDYADLKIAASNITFKTKKTVLTRKFSKSEIRNADRLNFQQFLELKKKYGASYKVQGVYAFSDLNEQQVDNARVAKIKYYQDRLQEIKDVAPLVMSDDWVDLDFLYITQKEDDKLGVKTVQKKKKGINVKMKIIDTK